MRCLSAVGIPSLQAGEDVNKLPDCPAFMSALLLLARHDRREKGSRLAFGTCYFAVTLMPTRRLCWRPSAVALSAIGFCSPYPSAVSRDASTPSAVT